MSTELTADATSLFKLQDIALWETSFTRANEYQPGLHDHTARVQSRRDTSAAFLEATIDDGVKAEFLRVIVSFALRVVAAEGSDETAIKDDNAPLEVLHEIEASFAVHYLVVERPEDSVLADFIAFNCVHNAWPFWRQHVFDVLKRASLPLVEIPLFSGRRRTPSADSKDEETKRG